VGLPAGDPSWPRLGENAAHARTAFSAGRFLQTESAYLEEKSVARSGATCRWRSIR
jgi:hypothetical protein